MATVDELFQAECNAQYVGEGMARAVEFLKRYAPWFEHQGDAISRSVTASLSTTVTVVKGSAGNLYALRITSGASAAADAYVQVFNSATAGAVTLGTTDSDLSLKVPATRTAVYVIVPGDDDNDLFSAGICIAATTTGRGNTALAAASMPTVEVIYA